MQVFKKFLKQQKHLRWLYLLSYYYYSLFSYYYYYDYYITFIFLSTKFCAKNKLDSSNTDDGDGNKLSLA